MNRQGEFIELQAPQVVINCFEGASELELQLVDPLTGEAVFVKLRTGVTVHQISLKSAMPKLEALYRRDYNLFADLVMKARDTSRPLQLETWQHALKLDLLQVSGLNEEIHRVIIAAAEGDNKVRLVDPVSGSSK